MSTKAYRVAQLSCHRKIPFASREDARRALKNFSRPDAATNGLPIVVYHCQACDRYHVGRKIRNRKQRATARRMMEAQP